VALEVGANRADGPPGLSAGPAPSRLPLETPDRRERSVLACRSRSVALTTFGVRPHWHRCYVVALGLLLGLYA